MKYSLRSSTRPIKLQGSSSNVPKRRKPVDFVGQLNSDISCIQAAVKQYNKRQQKNSSNRKNNPTINNLIPSNRDCPLKALTMPKYQNILLESNFSDNPIYMTQEEIKRSLVNKTVLGISKKNSLNQKNTSLISSGLGIKRTNSFVRSKGNATINKGILKNGLSNIEEEKEGCFPLADDPFTRNRNKSVKEQISKYQKAAILDKMSTINHSQKSPRRKAFFENKASFFDENEIEMSASHNWGNQSSKSVLLKSNMFVSHLNNEILNESVAIPLVEELPYRQEDSKELKINRTASLRKKIQSRVEKLETEWAKTENFRDNYNIAPSDQQQGRESTLTVSKNMVQGQSRKMKKLQGIISKVKNRRPSTSATERNTPRNFLNAAVGRHKLTQCAQNESLQYF